MRRHAATDRPPTFRYEFRYIDDSSLDRYIDAAVDRAVRTIDESTATVNHLTATTPDLFVNRVVDTPYRHTNATNDTDIGTPNRHTDTMMNEIIGTPTRHTIATPGVVVATPDAVIATPNTVVATPERHTNTNVAMVVATPDMVVATPNEHTIATFDTLGVPDEVFVDPERIRPDTHGATTSTHQEEMTPETEREFIEEYGWSTTAKTTTMIPPITSQIGNSSRTPPKRGIDPTKFPFGHTKDGVMRITNLIATPNKKRKKEVLTSGTRRCGTRSIATTIATPTATATAPAIATKVATMNNPKKSSGNPSSRLT
ncbi:hypothetical protein GE061_009956 [Apolygus lucorum]|uniref:Uncharacterized protein n=1 Tax=Apolygus lucorum TaxID=248454 RepID=A0A8S9Y303_APOLU|nr:hypothetical protein GE061_009956 [Apolygus lucorum]